MKYQAILLAAGDSSRSGLNYNKVLFELENNQKIIQVSMHNFLIDNECDKIFLVCKESEIEIFRSIFENEKKVFYVVGGKTRQESVYNALLKVDSEYVFIHDGARPYYSSILLNRLKDKLATCDAVIPVWSMKDTIKIVKDNIVEKTLNRNELKLVQTPQAFKTSLIKKVHELADNNLYSDDASLVELYSDEKVYTIDGEYTNIKYTYKEEF